MARGYLQDITFVDFYEKPIVTGYSEELGYVVPMKYIIEEHLGLDWKMQKRRMNESPLYNPVIVPGYVFDDGLSMEHEYPEDDIPTFTRNAEYTCLPVSELNLFLCQINTLKARPEVQETLYKYQMECGKALHDYWFRGMAINNRTNPSRISAKRHDWCPRELSTQSLKKACDRFSKCANLHFGMDLKPDDIFDHCRRAIADILLIESEFWDNQTTAVAFNLAFMERAAFDILYFSIEKNVHPEDLPDILDRNLNNAWEHMGHLVVNVQSAFSPFPNSGRGLPRELV